MTIDGATFSSPATIIGGLYVYDFFGDGNQQICSTVDDSTCSGDLGVSFASAISGLSFTASGDDTTSTLTVLLTLADLSTQTAFFTLDGVLESYDSIDLSEYGNILGISLSTDDPDGLAYDNFNFGPAQASAAPEPATWLVLMLGFGLAGGALRRRRSAARLALA